MERNGFRRFVEDQEAQTFLLVPAPWSPAPTLARLQMLWAVVALTWGYTAWAVYANLGGKGHVHIYFALLLVDLALPPLAVWMTIEWQRSVAAEPRPDRSARCGSRLSSGAPCPSRRTFAGPAARQLHQRFRGR